MQSENFLKDHFSPSRTSIGLDIGNFSVKIAQIKKRHFFKERFLSFAVVPIQGERSRDKVVETIRKAYGNVRAESRKVNISICGPNIIMRYITLPIMKKKDLFQSLEFELERYIPYKKEEVVVDSHILANLPNGKMVVLIVAAEHRIIEERISLIKDSGLEPQLINVDALALTEAFKITFPFYKGVVALLDIGYRTSKFVVMENTIPYFSRDIEIGLFEIIQAISAKTGVEFDPNKESSSDSNKEETVKELREAIRPVLDSLLNELFLCLEYCERNLGKRVEQLYLSGGGSTNKALIESLKEIPDLKIDFWEPTRGFKVTSPPTTEEVRKYSSLLGVAIGLALS